MKYEKGKLKKFCLKFVILFRSILDIFVKEGKKKEQK